MTDSAPDPMDGPARDDPPRLPLWVKALVIGAGVALLVLVLVMLVVGGEHGPGIHGG